MSKGVIIPGGRKFDYGNLVNRRSALNRGLVSWWLTLPKRTGGAFFRDIYAQNHGTLTNGPTWGGALGRPGGQGAIVLDGSDDHVGCGTDASLAFTSQLTVMAWARYVSGSSVAIVSRWDGAGYILWLNHSSSTVNWGDNSSVLVADFDSWIAATSGSWNHFCGTRDATTSRLYFNGIEVENAANGTLGTSTTQFAIGAYSGGNSGRWGGNIDDVRAFNRALPASEVLAAYNDSRLGYPQTLNRLRTYSLFFMESIADDDLAVFAATQARIASLRKKKKRIYL